MQLLLELLPPSTYDGALKITRDCVMIFTLLVLNEAPTGSNDVLSKALPMSRQALPATSRKRSDNDLKKHVNASSETTAQALRPESIKLGSISFSLPNGIHGHSSGSLSSARASRLGLSLPKYSAARGHCAKSRRACNRVARSGRQFMCSPWVAKSFAASTQAAMKPKGLPWARRTPPWLGALS